MMSRFSGRQTDSRGLVMAARRAAKREEAEARNARTPFERTAQARKGARQ